MIALTPHIHGTIVPVRAQPGARRNAVLGERAGALLVAVSAAPEKGKANAAIRTVLAEALGYKPSVIELIAGETAREKKFLVTGIAVAEIRARVDEILAGTAPPGA
jgi:uncharacterized protein YggU (UPF0235/DUF167 family)